MRYPQYTLGLVTGFCLCALYFMVPPLIESFRTEPAQAVEPAPSKSNFTVIEQYKGCDVVRWTQSNFAEYKYFLHCDKND